MRNFSYTLALLSLALRQTLLAASFAYVPNESLGTISIIDIATDQVVSEVPAGKKPHGTAVSADDRSLYVSDQPNNRLVVVSLSGYCQVKGG